MDRWVLWGTKRPGWYPHSRVDYVPCRVDDWRVTFKEPEDMKIGPEIPADAQWKLVPTDP